jgi:hypothetical protein
MDKVRAMKRSTKVGRVPRSKDLPPSGLARRHPSPDSTRESLPQGLAIVVLVLQLVLELMRIAQK